MSIYKGNKKVVALYKGATPIIRRYKGTQLIFDATQSDEPKNETLSFSWSGTSASQTFKINNATKTATTNPYSATLTVLGVDKFTSAYQMFYQKSAITAITSIPDTTDVTNMSYMFRNCGALTSLDVTKTFNTSNVTNMSQMFSYCYKLKTLDLSSFDTSKVTNTNSMFYNSTALTEVNLSGWDLRNVTSKSAMFGNGVKPSKVIMNGCDCDTILFIRQELRNNGVNHENIVITDTVCPTYEAYEKISYTYDTDIKDIAWNEQYKPSVMMHVESMDKYGVKTNSIAYISDSCEFIYNPSDNNETDENRFVTVTIYYKGEYIGETTYKQLVKPQDVGDTFYLNCNSSKDVPIGELIIDMNNVPDANGWWFGRFSTEPNGFGDCEECEDGNISISLHENVINGDINMQITDLPMNDEGKYVLTFDKPYYFQCAEQNFAFDNVLCSRNKSSCDDTISFRWDGNASDSFEFELQLMTRNVYREDCEDNGDGTYTYTTTLSDMGIETLTNCNWTFSHSRYLVELIKFPCTDTVTDMRDMFTSSHVSNLDLSSWDVSNVIVMAGMFNNCYNLETLNLNGWKLTDNVDIENMFSYCGSLREIYLKNSDDTTYMIIQDAVQQSGINATIITE